MSRDLCEELRTAIRDGDDTRAANIAKELSGDESALVLAMDVATETIRVVGDLFGKGELYLPEMVLAGEAMQAFVHVAGPQLHNAASTARSNAKIVIGTVKGDIHTIGKDIVATMLSASGFDVIDMGVDVAPMTMIESAEKAGAKVIALSAVMTTSTPFMKEVVELLSGLNKRQDFWVIVGGGPVTADYARSIGADGWAPNAGAAVRLCDKMISRVGKPSMVEFIREDR